MREAQNKKILRLAELAMLVALVVVLQLVSALIPPIGGTVSITLTLVPVVVGAILFGIEGGAILGATFGLIVLINCIAGLDPGGNLLWTANPVFTAVICIVKGTAAGIIPALLYKLAAGNCNRAGGGRKFVSALLAALSAPIVNTGLFVCGMFVFFKDILYQWAGDSNVFIYILVGLAGLNFLVEFIVNIILTPAIVRIVDVITKKKK